MVDVSERGAGRDDPFAKESCAGRTKDESRGMAANWILVLRILSEQIYVLNIYQTSITYMYMKCAFPLSSCDMTNACIICSATL